MEWLYQLYLLFKWKDLLYMKFIQMKKLLYEYRFNEIKICYIWIIILFKWKDLLYEYYSNEKICYTYMNIVQMTQLLYMNSIQIKRFAMYTLFNYEKICYTYMNII